MLLKFKVADNDNIQLKYKYLSLSHHRSFIILIVGLAEMTYWNSNGHKKKEDESGKPEGGEVKLFYI